MRKLLILILVASAALPVLAQAPPSPAPPSPATPPPPPPRPEWKDKLFFGGGVGAAFGDVDYVELAPLVGYRVHPRVSVGMSLLYRWKNDDRFGAEQSMSDYGASLYGRVTVYQPIFAQVEYEYIDYEYATSAGGTVRDSDANVLAGAGFAQAMGGHAGFYASALYNFSYDENDLTSAYDSAWVYRVGVTFGF